MKDDRDEIDRMETDVKIDFIFARKYEQDLINIVQDVIRKNLFLVVERSSWTLDIKHATDCVAMVSPGKYWHPFRVRRPDCLHRDLTIRSRRANGVETELIKIERECRIKNNDLKIWYVYAWTDKNETIPEWIVVDMKKLVDAESWEDAKSDQRENTDGKTWFTHIHLSDIEKAGALLESNIAKRGSGLPVPEWLRGERKIEAEVLAAILVGASDQAVLYGLSLGYADHRWQCFANEANRRGLVGPRRAANPYVAADEMIAESEGRAQHWNHGVHDMFAAADKKWGKLK